LIATASSAATLAMSFLLSMIFPPFLLVIRLYWVRRCPYIGASSSSCTCEMKYPART
jgi:hypothetical protein